MLSAQVDLIRCAAERTDSPPEPPSRSSSTATVIFVAIAASVSSLGYLRQLDQMSCAITATPHPAAYSGDCRSTSSVRHDGNADRWDLRHIGGSARA